MNSANTNAPSVAESAAAHRQRIASLRYNFLSLEPHPVYANISSTSMTTRPSETDYKRLTLSTSAYAHGDRAFTRNYSTSNEFGSSELLHSFNSPIYPDFQPRLVSYGDINDGHFHSPNRDKIPSNCDINQSAAFSTNYPQSQNVCLHTLAQRQSDNFAQKINTINFHYSTPTFVNTISQAPCYPNANVPMRSGAFQPIMSFAVPSNSSRSCFQNQIKHIQATSRSPHQSTPLQKSAPETALFSWQSPTLRNLHVANDPAMLSTNAPKSTWSAEGRLKPSPSDPVQLYRSVASVKSIKETRRRNNLSLTRQSVRLSCAPKCIFTKMYCYILAIEALCHVKWQVCQSIKSSDTMH